MNWICTFFFNNIQIYFISSSGTFIHLTHIFQSLQCARTVVGMLDASMNTTDKKSFWSHEGYNLWGREIINNKHNKHVCNCQMLCEKNSTGKGYLNCMEEAFLYFKYKRSSQALLKEVRKWAVQISGERVFQAEGRASIKPHCGRKKRASVAGSK